MRTVRAAFAAITQAGTLLSAQPRDTSNRSESLARNTYLSALRLQRPELLSQPTTCLYLDVHACEDEQLSARSTVDRRARSVKCYRRESSRAVARFPPL